MKLEITLLSDLCTCSGETYNSLIDTDVVYDDYGFPFIPAKRLKGCIREACLELEEFEVVYEGSVDRIFGKEGNSPSMFSLSDTKLKNYHDLCLDLERETDGLLIHPQNVLGIYSYLRTQTSLDSETGAPKKNFLRTIRVIKKGLEFEANMYIGEDFGEQEREILIKASEMVTHIGLHRTRGLGNVRIRCQENGADDTLTKVHVGQLGKKNKLDYSIKLLSPMLCKCAEGNLVKAQPYIEGSKVLGLIAGALSQTDFDNLMSEELIISNAYIMNDGKRCTPIAASLKRKKDQTFENGNIEAYDMLTMTDNNQDRMKSMEGYFVDRDNFVVSVDTEINYHHKRPSDKSIGRASEKDDSAFYQLESIRQGQIFGGYILASREQADMIFKVWKELKNVHMGYSRNTQYGSVMLEIAGSEICTPNIAEKRMHEFRVKLNAPVILYNENGMYSSNIKDLKNYLEDVLGVSDLQVGKMFLKYETVGGFNVTWNRRKPVITALGGGSVCIFHSCTGIIVSEPHIFVGERVSEGYGEIEIMEIPPRTVLLQEALFSKDTAEEKDKSDKTDIILLLAQEQCFRDIDKRAREDAACAYSEYAFKKEIDAVIAKMIQICREQHNYEDMKKQVDGIEVDEKRNIALRLSKDIANLLEQKYQYQERIDWKLNNWKDIVYRRYSNAYLEQLKYLIRPSREERRKKHE